MRSVYLYSIVALSLIGLCAASHGRFGTISTRKSVSNPRVVEITLNVAWRRTYFGSPNPGSIIRDFYLNYGDGTSITPDLRVTSINTADDWLTAVWVGTKTYAGAGTYTLSTPTCCRIGNLNNNAGFSYTFTSVVKITAAEIAGSAYPNNSPVSGMLPIITVPQGTPNFQYQISVNDPENDALTYRLATPAEMGQNNAVQPTGLTVSPSGLVTLTATLGLGYWSTQQVVTDSFGNVIVVDYLLNVETPRRYCEGNCIASASSTCRSDSDCISCNSSCLTAVPRVVINDLSSTSVPRTNYPAYPAGTSISVAVGQTVTLSFVVDDANLINTATAPSIFTAAVPAFATVSTVRACTAANGCTYVGPFQRPQFLTISVTPPQSSENTVNVLCIGATSLGNQLPYSQHCVEVYVPLVSSVCGNGIIERGEVCDGGACCASDCRGYSTSVCRASTGPCDAAEVCDGSSVTCPADSLSSASTVCRASAGPCDVAETCTGSSVSCPADSFSSSGDICRASAGPCDVAETCSGSSAACPADSFQSSSLTCRASSGDCDVAETCSGSSAACPADSFQSSSVVCRASAGSCDAAETCTGSSGVCPADSVSSSGTVCRASAGACDTAEVCDGSSGVCPADVVVAAGSTCRASAGICDVAETCDGSSTSCPADSVVAAGSTCRASSGDCDIAETCDGSATACPADSFQSSSVVCRASAGSCDAAETCTGSSGSCPADTVAAAGTTCRASAGICDVAEVCDGSSGACPAETFVASGTTCRASAGVCDVAETCSGSSASCPADSVVAAGSTCRASAGNCDVAETCDGSATSCPADTVVAAGTTCRASAGSCDAAEVCTGSSGVCPADSVAAAGTVCRAAAGVCDAVERCDGSSGACPADIKKTSVDVCRAQNGSCDIAETCSLGTNNCPTDQFNSSSDCRSAAVVCPRLNNVGDNGEANLWCSPFDTSVYYSCQTGPWRANSAARPCAPGTGCYCPYGVNCGLCGSPCTLPGSPPATPESCGRS